LASINTPAILDLFAFIYLVFYSIPIISTAYFSMSDLFLFKSTPVLRIH